MLLTVWLLTFALSWLNAWGCGKNWNETKHVGGFPHALNWCGAILSTTGFTWCYLIPFAFIGTVIPMEKEGTEVVKYLVSADLLRLSLELGYLMVFVPLAGIGVAIAVNAWANFQRQDLLTGAVAAGAAFAGLYGINRRGGGGEVVSAVGEGVADLGLSLAFDGDGEGGLFILAIVVAIIFVSCAVGGGIFTTRAIIKATARSSIREMRSRYSGSAQAA